MTDVPPPPPPPPSDSFGAPPPGAGGPDVGTALSYGWKKFQQSVGPLILAFIIPAVVSLIFNLIGIAFNSIVLRLLLSVVAFVATQAAGIAIYRVALQITAGETPDVGKAFQYDRWGEWILFSIVFGLFVGIGLALCIIPGLFVLAFYGLAPFYFIDGRMGIGEALTASQKATSSKGLAFPVLLSVVVGVLGIIVCFVGVLVTAPVVYVAVAYLYKYSIGQPVAA